MRCAVFTVAIVGTACTLFTPLGTDLTTGDPSTQPEAGTPPPDGSVAADSAAEASTADADASTTPCKPGDTVRPIRAFDATPAAISANATVCNVDAVLVEDQVFAALDRNSDADGPALIGGTQVTSCLGAEMPPGTLIARVLLRAAAIGNGCGTACNPAYCGTGDNFAIFIGPTATDLVLLEEYNDVSLAARTIDLQVSDAVPARFVVACRANWGTSRDDIAIDSIAAICR